MGMFSLSAVEPIRAVVFELKTASDVIFDASEDYITQHSADEDAVITKTDRASFSPFRMGSSRTAFLWPLSNIANVLVQPTLSPYVRISYAHFNNAIPLKLRI
jgi:hypothetical protein